MIKKGDLKLYAKYLSPNGMGVSSKNLRLFAHSLLTDILNDVDVIVLGISGEKLNDKGRRNWYMWLIITLFFDMDSKGP